MAKFREGRRDKKGFGSGRGREDNKEESFRDFRERRNDKRSFRGSSRGGSRGRGNERMEMHPAVCDECGKSCEVPFKPTSSKPIFCSECFEKKEKRGRGDDRRGNSNDLKPSLYELDVINRKLDKIMKKLGIE